MSVLKKHLERADKFESQVMELALNKKESSRDDGWGVYYSKGGKRLVTAKKTIEGDYAVKEDTQEIGDNAFWGCAFLRKVAMPASVKTLDPYAFACCDSLKKVTFLGMPEHIARTTFSDCDNLMSIVVPQGKEKKFRKLLHITVESDTLVLGE